jgi:hypothetical protein
MKKGFLSAIVAVGVLGMGGADAQITLLQTFEESITPTNYYTSAQQTDFDGFVSGTRIYNEDFSVRASFNISAPSGYQFANIQCVSEKIFNTDSKLEFLVSFIKTPITTTAEMSSYYWMRLYDENGNILKDFGTTYMFTPTLVALSNGNYILLVQKTEQITTNPDNTTTIKYKTEVYSLPGKKEVSSISSPPQIKERKELAYKLKEGETATMKIYNIKGQVVETKTIDHTFNKILLNTARYPRGTYIYKINDKNATKFVLR